MGCQFPCLPVLLISPTRKGKRGAAGGSLLRKYPVGRVLGAPYYRLTGGQEHWSTQRAAFYLG